jgi:hypothetical protein
MTVFVITQTYKFKDMPKTVPALNHEEQAYFIILLSPVPFTGGLKNYKETEECKIMS